MRIIKEARPVTEQDVQQLQDTVAAILKKVRSEGDSALRFYARQFDNYEKEFRVTPEQAAEAGKVLPPEVIEELDFAIDQVTAFATAQRGSIKEFEKEFFPGFTMGHRVLPVASGRLLRSGRQVPPA